MAMHGLDIILYILISGFVAALPLMVLAPGIRNGELIKELRARAKNKPAALFLEAGLLVGYLVFFGSLFMASLGLPTWWSH